MKPYGLHRPSSKHCHFLCSIIMVQRKLCQLIQNHTKALFLPYTSELTYVYLYIYICVCSRSQWQKSRYRAVQAVQLAPSWPLITNSPPEVTPTLLVFDFIYMVSYSTYSFVSGFFSQSIFICEIHPWVCIFLIAVYYFFCMNVSQFTYSSYCRWMGVLFPVWSF